MAPLVKISKNIYAKCEFLNPRGSHKDRSLKPWLKTLVAQNHFNFVISSSGNAAISAAYYVIREPKIKSLVIFVSNKLSPSKQARLNNILGDDHKRIVTIKKSSRAKSEAIKFARDNKAYLLRASTDDLAKLGYHKLAQELHCELPDCDAIFFPISSGTSLAGVYDGYKKLSLQKIPAFHAAQTEAVHPLSNRAKTPISTTRSIAEAICDRVAHRKLEVQNILRETKGQAWVIPEPDILKYTKELLQQDFPVSPESGLVLASAREAQKKGLRYNKTVVILTGLK